MGTAHQSTEPLIFQIPSEKEIRTLYKLTLKSLKHNSGCSYNMVCLWAKGNNRLYGYNKLTRAASTFHDHFPEVCGQHAEVHLLSRFSSLSGGTLYIAGTRETSKAFMSNTRPCKFCMPEITKTGIRFLVYFQDNEPIKVDIREMRD